MNKLFILVFLGLGLMISSCSSSGSVRDKNANLNDDDMVPNAMNYLDLVERLRRDVAVNLTGSGTTIRATVRGAHSVQGDTRPLIVVNGTIMGRDLVQINRNIDPNTIKRVRVVKSLSDLAVWGDQGVSGVVLVETTNK